MKETVDLSNDCKRNWEYASDTKKRENKSSQLEEKD